MDEEDKQFLREHMSEEHFKQYIDTLELLHRIDSKLDDILDDLDSIDESI